MFATHDDLATAEFQLLEVQRKVKAQTSIIAELTLRGQPTRLAERFLERLETSRSIHLRDRDALLRRLQAETA